MCKNKNIIISSSNPAVSPIPGIRNILPNKLINLSLIENSSLLILNKENI